MPFDPSKPFTVEDGSNTAGGFDPSKPFTLETADPAEEERQYISSLSKGVPLPSFDEYKARTKNYYKTSAIDRSVKAIKTAVGGGTLSPEEASEEQNQSFYGVPLADIRANGGFLGNVAANALGGVSNVLTGIGTHAAGALDELGQGLDRAVDETRAGNYLAAPKLAGREVLALGSGIGKGAYGLAKPIVTGSIGLVRSVPDALRRDYGDVDAAAEDDAATDYARLKYEQNVEAPTNQALTTASGLPNTESLVSDVAPFVIPLGVGVKSAGLASRAGGAVEKFLAPSGTAAASVSSAGIGSTALGLADSAISHIPKVGLLYRGAKGLVRMGAAASEEAPGLARVATGGLDAPYVPIAQRSALESRLAQGLDTPVGPRKVIGQYNTLDQAADAKAAGQIVGAGINASGAALTGAGYGLASAEPGDEAEGVRSGAAFGLLTTPAAVIHGGYARQAAEQLAQNTALAEAGARRTAGTDLLAPEQANQINAIQGLLNNREGTGRIRVLSPEDFADSVQNLESAASFVGETNSGKEGARGYFHPETKESVINSQPFSLDENGNKVPVDFDVLAVPHETGHALPEILNHFNPGSGDALVKALDAAALPNGKPSPALQKLVSAYSGERKSWDTLTPDQQRAYLDEYGAQTVLAQQGLLNPGQFALKPEFSDIVFNALGDFARRNGGGTPNLLNLLSPDYAPTDARALTATRNALQSIGQRERSGILPPVRPEAPVRREVTYPALVPSNQGIGARPASLAPRISRVPVPEIRIAQPERQLATAGGGSEASVPNGYGDAMAVATLPKKLGGLGLSREDAESRLTKAVDAGATNAESLLFHAQTGRLPGQAASGGTAPATEATPQAEIPQPADAEAAQGEVAPTNRIPDASPSRLGTEGNSNTASTPETSREPQAEQSIATSPDATARDVETQQPPVAIPFTAEDFAKRLTDTAANFKPKPYKPRGGTAEEQQAKIAKDAADQLKAAQQEAIMPLLEQHRDALPEGDNRVRLQVDEDTGKLSVKGQRFVQGDPLHEALLNRADLTPEGRNNLQAVQDAIAGGNELNFDYLSADTEGTGVTGAGRQKAQANSSASDRAAGQGAIQEADKSFFPLSLTANPNGSIQAFGFSPDKLISNAQRLLDYFRDKGDRSLPYQNVNSPEFVADFRAYAANHANGYKGDGSAALVGTDKIPVSVNSEYTPTQIPKAQADFLNLVTQGSEAAAQSLQGKAGSKTPTVKAQQIIDFAKANGLTPDAATNEVNALRAQINAAGDLTAADGKGGLLAGTKNVLESPFENNRVDLISNLKPGTDEPPATGPNANLRAQAFRQGRGQLVSGGLPVGKTASAGFLPSRDQTGWLSPDGKLTVLRDHAPMAERETGKYGDDAYNGMFSKGYARIVADRDGIYYNTSLEDGPSKLTREQRDAIQDLSFDRRQQVTDSGTYKVDKNLSYNSGGTQFLPAREAGATPEQAADAARQWREKGTDSPFFQKWFAGSKVTDDNNKPKIVYHGTDQNFDTFETGKNVSIGGGKLAGHYFTPDPKYAADYGDTIKPAYLALKNPYVVPRDGFEHTNITASKRTELEAQGYDGVMFEGDEKGKYPPEYIAFDDAQISTIK